MSELQFHNKSQTESRSYFSVHRMFTLQYGVRAGYFRGGKKILFPVKNIGDKQLTISWRCMRNNSWCVHKHTGSTADVRVKLDWSFISWAFFHSVWQHQILSPDGLLIFTGVCSPETSCDWKPRGITQLNHRIRYITQKSLDQCLMFFYDMKSDCTSVDAAGATESFNSIASF